MQWDDSLNAGFSKSNPWIHVNPNYKYINVKEQLEDDDSILNFYKKMIKIKKSSECLIYGKYNLILEDDTNIFAYERILNDEKSITKKNYETCISKLAEIGRMVGGLIKANPDVRKSPNE